MAQRIQPDSAQQPAIKLISLEQAQSRLILVWCCGGALILGLVVLQSVFQRAYANKVREVWLWLLPMLMPTLGMMVAVWGGTALEKNVPDLTVRKGFYTLCLALSSAYLCLILLGFFVAPAQGADAEARIGILRESNLWLGPLQGLVTGSIGVLFVSKQRSRRR